jgi:hypothetical protein
MMHQYAFSLKLEVVWKDEHMQELRLSAANTNFAGQVSFYVSHDEPAVLAKHLEGFPNNEDDVREYELGGANLPGYGGARIRLYCKDWSGHLALQITIYKNPLDKDCVESATVRLLSEPSAIDRFVDELKSMQANVGDVAALMKTN